jgi:hypothetical protein
MFGRDVSAAEATEVQTVPKNTTHTAKRIRRVIMSGLIHLEPQPNSVEAEE